MKKMFIVLGIASLVYACGGSEEKKVEPAPGTEKAADTPAAAATNPHEKGLELIGANDCTTCHAINEKKIGPAYADVAQKYENSQAVIDTLVNKVIHGGSGNWGNVPMTAHPNLSKEDATEMVQYILSLKK